MRALAIAFAAASGLTFVTAIALAAFAVSVPGYWILIVVSLCSLASAVLALVSVLRASRRPAGLTCGGLAVVCATVVIGAQIFLAQTRDPEPYAASEVLLLSLLGLWTFVGVTVGLAGSPQGHHAPTA